MKAMAVLGAIFLAACGESTGAQSPDASAGMPTVLASNQKSPWTIAIDDQNVYWVNADSQGGVFKVSKSGGAVTTLDADSVGQVESIGVDSTSVYFPLESEIVAAPIGGGSAKAITGAHTQSLAVAGGNVFWIDRADPATSAPISAKMIPVSGGSAVAIALPMGVPTVGGALVTVASTDGVYASLTGGGDLLRLPLGGGTADILPVSASSSSIAIDDTTIYLGVQGVIEKMPKAGGTPTNIATAENPTGIAVDDAFVYVADDTSTGRILKVSKTGGPVTVLADNQGAPHAIAVDATSVYWNCINEGTIKKIAK